MKRSRMRTAALLFLALAACSCWAPKTASEKEELVDQLLSDYAQPGEPGASVLVVQNGSAVLKKSFGLASLEEPRACTPTTDFRLASVTKQFTAMAIMILVSDSKLSLDDRLTKFFPDFPAYGAQISVRHLLTHTSGLLDYESLMPDTQTVQIHDKGVLRLLESVDSTYFLPGSEFRYSNSAYAILSLIVKKVSGQSFAQFLRTHIFDPLGMKNTVAYERGISVVPERAFGYTYTDSGWVFADQSPTSAVLGDGGIYTSIEDMQKWDHSLSVGYLVPLYLLRKAWTPATLNDGSETDYGFGWFLDPYGRYPRQYHTGSTYGFRNVIMRFPVQQLSIVILTNRNEGDLKTLAEDIADIYLE